MDKLFIDLVYDLDKDEFDISTNIKEEKVTDLLTNFLMTQMGKGVDESKAEELEKYHIRIELDMTLDNFSVKDDCGNKGLRDGILLRYIGKNR